MSQKMLCRDGESRDSIDYAGAVDQLVSGIDPENWLVYRYGDRLSAHYKDIPNGGKNPFWVPVLSVDSNSVSNISGFIRQPMDSCGWCGYPHNNDWKGYECPQCGGV